MKPDRQSAVICSTVADCSTSGKPSVADENLISLNINAGCSTVADKNAFFPLAKENPSLPEVLQRLKQAGVELELVQGKIRYRGPAGVITPEIMEALRSRKAELLTLLEKRPAVFNPAGGKALIRETQLRIAEAWNEMENSRGSIAWEWILRGSLHGVCIRQAEDKVNTIGSRGNPAALKAACDAWVSAWRDAIEAWKRRLPAKGTGPDQGGGSPAQRRAS